MLVIKAVAVLGMHVSQEVHDHPVLLIFCQVQVIGSPPRGKLHRCYLVFQIADEHVSSSSLRHVPLLPGGVPQLQEFSERQKDQALGAFLCCQQAPCLEIWMDTALDPGRIALFYAFNIVKHCSPDRCISGVNRLTDYGWFSALCLPLSPLPPLGKRASLFNYLPAGVDTFIANTEVSWPWSESSYLVLPLATERTVSKGERFGFFAIPHEFPAFLCGVIALRSRTLHLHLL